MFETFYIRNCFSSKMNMNYKIRVSPEYFERDRELIYRAKKPILEIDVYLPLTCLKKLSSGKMFMSIYSVIFKVEEVDENLDESPSSWAH